MLAKQFLKTGGALIGLYLVVSYATGFGKAADASSKGTVGVIKAFQGR